MEPEGLLASLRPGHLTLFLAMEAKQACFWVPMVFSTCTDSLWPLLAYFAAREC